MDAAAVGGLGGTFAGNPVACAAALAVLETMERENLCARAMQLGERFVDRARQWRERWLNVGAIHGLGAMRAIELIRSPDSREPAESETKEVVKHCYENGLITISAGTYGNVIRLLMPLVISDEQFLEGLGVIESALEHVFGQGVPISSLHKERVVHA
jgi:4-aminobutyrate aminotransferase/(S)-3-amino-2-methylpropionate transaminase